MQRSYPILKEKYTVSPVTLVQAKQWLKLDIPGYVAEDAKIQELIDEAIGYVETETNLSLAVSDYEWYTSTLPCEIRDKYLIQSITSIEEEGDSGFTVIPASNYSLIRESELRSRIRWAASFRTSKTFFRVTFKAGYPEGKIEKNLLRAVRGLIAEWYEAPGDYVREKKTMVDRLLAPFVLPYAG
ncbi:putative phiE125 gp8 family phage protein [Dyadobacter sp. BE34]|uniref:PhiE125 gp8 family phage protein n=1 Tax=Dyadobacter fermentans TaxID=94254 RepID=A0ABU1QWN7_9BACT|nr:MULTISPECIES: hypothetical protein [Dyadobacter]MDR6805566.1 putative phiE125 gp8 family phage protein [Dyadobacter fermentans]MDR7042674.1 putative phiE125 gp8 family phage protein [Dyadobacter sp. BE242]MDR7196986.1 putative phiE125 gp8 family phage protein [Dyadobacter sp. BE34]MDR7215579.1 putative phiE125 gp8 family phage protein [Dyadobacter sp. BE31]MDR7263115.1 putative phiE125 gp8 family phage protein [Dyadobacter sp. BE32]